MNVFRFITTLRYALNDNYEKGRLKRTSLSYVTSLLKDAT